MSADQSFRRQVSKWTLIAIVMLLAAASAAWIRRSPAPQASVAGADKLAASIFSYEGQEFVRTSTTLVTEAGKSAANTKLEGLWHACPAAWSCWRRRSGCSRYWPPGWRVVTRLG